jgi:hypothetical protein
MLLGIPVGRFGGKSGCFGRFSHWNFASNVDGRYPTIIDQHTEQASLLTLNDHANIRKLCPNSMGRVCFVLLVRRVQLVTFGNRFFTPWHIKSVLSRFATYHFYLIAHTSRNPVVVVWL